MKIVKVTYTTKADFVAQNQKNIKKMMADLHHLNNPGIHYHVCLGADGRTFIHTVFFRSEEDEIVLNQIPSFKDFQKQLKASNPKTPPKQELLELVASAGPIFNRE